MADTREPRPGERCACGRPAEIVFIKLLGAVPNCSDCKPKLETHAPRRLPH